MRRKILVADDDRDFVRVLRERLEASGYDTVYAHEGVRTVEVAHKEKPDLILLDWVMPAGRGSAVLDALSKKDGTRRIPVIVISGSEEPSMMEKSDVFGVKAVFLKPYDSKALLAKIREVLEWKRYEESLT